MSEKTLGGNLAEARKLVFLTQSQTAELIGIGVRAVQYHEADEHRPGDNTLNAYAKIYECDKSWLLKRIGAPPGKKKMVIYQTEDAVPHMLDKPEGAVEDKNGLWGETRRHKKEGVPFDVSLFKPEDGFDSYRDAQEGLREIYETRDATLIHAIAVNIRAFRLSPRLERQATQQAGEIDALKKECDHMKEENELMKKRLDALEEKLSDRDKKETKEGEIKKGEAA